MTAWPRIPICSIVKVIGGGTPTRTNPDYYGGDIPWVTPKDMKTWNIRGAQVTLTELGLNNSAARLAPAYSVLVVVRSGVLKHTVPVGINSVPVAINQDMKALICTEAILPSYLARFIKGRSGEILKWVRATTADNFPIEKLKDLKIPLPPIDEQRWIAEVLDRADELHAKRRQAIALLDGLAQSIFLDMFGDPTTNPKGWEISTFDSIVQEFRYGTSNKSGNYGLPALRIPNVLRGKLDLRELKLVSVTDAEEGRLQLKDGDLLFVRTNGNPDYVGRCTTFSEELVQRSDYPSSRFIYASYLIRARLQPGRFNPEYVREFMLSSAGRKALREHSKTSAGQFNINIDGLGRVPVPRPPLALQSEFAQTLRQVEASQAIHEAYLAELDELFGSLQMRAFRGEL